MRRSILNIALTTMALLILLPCAFAKDRLSVFVSIAPQKYFVQPQFSAKSAQLIAREIDGQVAFVDPLAQDWSANLREVANKFKAALK